MGETIITEGYHKLAPGVLVIQEEATVPGEKKDSVAVAAVVRKEEGGSR